MKANSVSAAAIILFSLACKGEAPLRKYALEAPRPEKQRALFAQISTWPRGSSYVFAFPAGTPKFPADPDNRLTRHGVELGRWLFYDTILSEDNTMSCASCHQQAKAFTDGQKFSPGVHGENTGFNSMSLVNLAWNKDFFWDGRVKTLRAQVLEPIRNTRELNLPTTRLVARLKSHELYPRFFELAFGSRVISEEKIARALAQFLASIVSFESPLDEVRRAEIGVRAEASLTPELSSFLLKNMDAETREAVNLCGSCHNGSHRKDGAYMSALYGGTKMTNNGLRGAGSLFKVPDLRNISLTGPYMHDGRFATLDDVLDHYSQGIEKNPNLDELLIDEKGNARRLRLSARTRENLKRYLALMTDKSYLVKAAYSDPFR